MTPTFASLLTPEGIIVAAGLVTSLVAVLKTTFPVLDAKVSGALQAFALSLALYVLTAVATGVPSFDAGLLIFASWLGCATSAIGIHGAVTHAASQVPPA